MVDIHSKLCVVVCGCFFLFLKGISTLELKSYSACYGNIGLNNFLQPKYVSGEKMAVVGLTTYAKKLSSSCPLEITITNVASTPDSCCDYNPNDCSIRYYGSSYRNYYQQCNGKENCRIQVSWVVTTCNQTVYLARTNYMKMDYYCISDQVLDPCSSLNTKDSKVFLWNPGYPSSPLTGASSCTCSFEASCVSTVRITAIDLRLGSSTACDQSLTITDGGTVLIFDCNDNNEYLPVTMYVSTSHFIQIQIADNLGLADGYFFLLHEGTSPGAELTLSCGSAAQATPTVPSTSLSDCSRTDVITRMKTTRTVTSTDPYIGSEVPNPSLLSTKRETMTIMTTPNVFTTEITTTPRFTSTKSDISSEASILSMQSTNAETITIPTVVATHSVIEDSYTTSDIPHNVDTSTELPITRKSEVTLTTTNDVNTFEKIITNLYSKTNNEITIPSGKTTNRSTDGISNSTEINNSQTTKDAVNYTSTEPVYVSLGWTSTLQNLTVTRSFTPISPNSNSSQKTPLTEIEQTTFTNVSVSVDKTSPNTIRPLIIGFSVTVIVICILVIVFMLYRYKRKGMCCKFSSRTKNQELEDVCTIHQMTTI